MTELEAAVIDLLLVGDDRQLEILREQRRALRVTKREHTGVGFFTELETPADVDALPGAPNLQFGDVLADIDGLAHPVGFVLVVDHGRITMLEGYTLSDERWPERISRFSLRYTSEPRDLTQLR